MLRVDHALTSKRLRSRLILQVHDELVLEVAPEERDVVELLVRTEMAAATDLSVPLDVNIGTGHDWAAAAH